MTKEVLTFTSIEQYQDHIYDVDMSAYQVSAGGFFNLHKNFFMPNVTIGYRMVDSEVIHQAHMPPNQFYCILPFNHCQVTFDGITHSKDKFLFIGPDEHSFSNFPKHTENLYITFGMEALRKYFDAEEIDLLMKSMSAIREGKLELDNLPLFREVAFSIFHRLFSAEHTPNYVELMDTEQTLFRALRSLVSPIMAKLGQKIMLPTRKTVVVRAIEFLEQGNVINVNVPELADACFCSVRTLEYAFKSILGKSPNQFLKLRKFHLVRRHLLSHNNRNASEVLRLFSISNHGRFASEYRQVFGETPFKTLSTK